MHKLRIILPFMLLILVSALPSNSHFSSDGTIHMKVGEVLTIGENLRLGFNGVLMDSRCPENAFCIWEGDAVAKMWADDPLIDRVTVELHTHRGFQWQFTFGEYRIALVGVSPYPKMDERIDPNDYIAIITVSSISTPVEMTSWGQIKALYE